jgi:hypothetical protein
MKSAERSRLLYLVDALSGAPPTKLQRLLAMASEQPEASEDYRLALEKLKQASESTQVAVRNELREELKWR